MQSQSSCRIILYVIYCNHREVRTTFTRRTSRFAEKWLVSQFQQDLKKRIQMQKVQSLKTPSQLALGTWALFDWNKISQLLPQLLFMSILPCSEFTKKLAWILVRGTDGAVGRERTSREGRPMCSCSVGQLCACVNAERPWSELSWWWWCPSLLLRSCWVIKWFISAFY